MDWCFKKDEATVFIGWYSKQGITVIGYESGKLFVSNNMTGQKPSDEKEIIICIPGPWKDRMDFTKIIMEATESKYMFTVGILACPTLREHIKVEIVDSDPQMKTAFRYASQQKMDASTLDVIDSHNSVAYLHFPLDVVHQKERISMFTKLFKEIGGYAIKIENTGISHNWNAWEEIMSSDKLFDLYRGFVVLIGDDQCYYSCGMHNFLLPDVQISKKVDINEAAETMNAFNLYQINEKPTLKPGHTFSLSENAPHYTLNLKKDFRHKNKELFHNTNGIWELVTG